MFRTALLLACALVAAACTTTSGAKDGAPAEAAKPKRLELPPELEKLRAREGASLSGQAFRSEDGAFVTTIDAAGPITEAESEIRIPIGAQTPVTCVYVGKRADPGSFATSILAQFIHNEQSAESLQILEERVSAIEAAGAIPVLFIDSLYKVKADNNVGTLKSAFAYFEDDILTCLHDELGYEQTFQRVVRGAVARRQGGAKPTGFVALSRIEVNGNLAGFERSLVFPGEEGATTYASIATIIAPQEPGRLGATDVVEREDVDAKGGLISRDYVKTEANEVLEQLHLEPDEDRFEVSGQVEGEDVDTEVAGSGPLLGTFDEVKFVRAMRAGQTKPVTYDRWSPSQEPGTRESLTLAPAEGRPGWFVQKTPRFAIQMRFDDAGLPLESRIEEGELVIRSTRIGETGSAKELLSKLP